MFASSDSREFNPTHLIGDTNALDVPDWGHENVFSADTVVREDYWIDVNDLPADAAQNWSNNVDFVCDGAERELDEYDQMAVDCAATEADWTEVDREMDYHDWLVRDKRVRAGVSTQTKKVKVGTRAKYPWSPGWESVRENVYRYQCVEVCDPQFYVTKPEQAVHSVGELVQFEQDRKIELELMQRAWVRYRNADHGRRGKTDGREHPRRSDQFRFIADWEVELDELAA